MQCTGSIHTRLLMGSSCLPVFTWFFFFFCPVRFPSSLSVGHLARAEPCDTWRFSWFYYNEQNLNQNTGFIHQWILCVSASETGIDSSELTDQRAAFVHVCVLTVTSYAKRGCLSAYSAFYCHIKFKQTHGRWLPFHPSVLWSAFTVCHYWGPHEVTRESQLSFLFLVQTIHPSFLFPEVES